ncbi:hypothetical protein L1887_13748 [Cichorium endivia]|nr:hypothetical protein L1887_13748 [Cichorium endivia]
MPLKTQIQARYAMIKILNPPFKKKILSFHPVLVELKCCDFPSNTRCSSRTLSHPNYQNIAFRQSNSELGSPKIKITNMAAGPMFLTESPFAGDLCALAFSTCFALSLLRVFEETAKRGVFDQNLNRKLVHITIGLAFILCWPLFGSGSQGAFMLAIVPGVNIVKMLLIGNGILKDEATVKSMSRFGDYRELLTGPLYYACTLMLCCTVYWRTSPIAIAAICNLSAGDGFADIIGRRFGKKKLPYNKDKSFAGTVAMALAGFIASIGYMYYFSIFGFIENSLKMVAGFLVVSLASALVESHPISTMLDDNLTVPLTSVLVGTFVFS